MSTDWIIQEHPMTNATPTAGSAFPRPVADLIPPAREPADAGGTA